MRFLLLPLLVIPPVVVSLEEWKVWMSDSDRSSYRLIPSSSCPSNLELVEFTILSQQSEHLAFTLECEDGTILEDSTDLVVTERLCVSPEVSCTLNTSGAWSLYRNFELFATNAPKCYRQVESQFTIRFDQFSEEVGWAIQCGEQTIVHRERGSFPSETFARTVLTESYCLPKDETCHLTVTDSPEIADGLTAGTPGSFEWTVDNQRIAYYNGAWPQPDFDTLSFCHGDDCPQCVPVQFDLRFDEYPEQVGYSIVCNDNNVVLQQPPGTFTQPNTLVMEDVCIDKQDCCELIILDEGNDGLTAGTPGFFLLQVNQQTKAFYEGQSQYQYHELRISFGNC